MWWYVQHEFRGDETMKRFVLGLAVALAMSITPAFAGLIDLVPAEAPFVLNLNMGKMLTFEPMKAMIDESFGTGTPEGKKALEEFTKKMGFDPFKQLANILIYSPEAGFKAEDMKDHVGILVDGSFDAKKLVEGIKADEDFMKQVDLVAFEGLTAIAGKTSGRKAAFLDDKTAIMGADAVIKAAATVKNGKAKSLATEPAFAAMMKKVDANAGVWGCALVTADMKAQAKANPISAPLAAANAMFLSVTFGNDMGISAAAEVAKADEAKAVADCLKNYVDMFKAWAVDVPELVDVFKMAKIDTNGTTVKFGLNLPKAQFDTFIAKMQERMAAPAQEVPAAPAPEKK